MRYWDILTCQDVFFFCSESKKIRDDFQPWFIQNNVHHGYPPSCFTQVEEFGPWDSNKCLAKVTNGDVTLEVEEKIVAPGTICLRGKNAELLLCCHGNESRRFFFFSFGKSCYGPGTCVSKTEIDSTVYTLMDKKMLSSPPSERKDKKKNIPAASIVQPALTQR